MGSEFAAAASQRHNYKRKGMTDGLEPLLRVRRIYRHSCSAFSFVFDINSRRGGTVSLDAEFFCLTQVLFIVLKKILNSLNLLFQSRWYPLSDLDITNLTLSLHWSNTNSSPLTDYAWLLTEWWPACFWTNHLDIQLPPALELFVSCGYNQPFIWSGN